MLAWGTATSKVQGVEIQGLGFGVLGFGILGFRVLGRRVLGSISERLHTVQGLIWD